MQPGLSCCSLLVIWAHVAVEIQGSSSPKEHCPLLSCSLLMNLWFFWGSVLWGLSCEQMGKLRQAAFSMGCWDQLEAVIDPGMSLPVALVVAGIVTSLWMSPEEVWWSNCGSPTNRLGTLRLKNNFQAAPSPPNPNPPLPSTPKASGEGQSRLQCRAGSSSDEREREGGDVGRNKWPHLEAQFPSLRGGISCLWEQGTKSWVLLCLPPANGICEEPVGPALQHHPSQ